MKNSIHQTVALWEESSDGAEMAAIIYGPGVSGRLMAPAEITSMTL